MTWLDAVDVRLDPVDRARVLAASMTGAGWAETVFDARYDEVWSRMGDLETSVPAADPFVKRLVVRRRERDAGGVERIELVTWAPSWLPRTTFDVRLEEGFCLMRARSRLFTVVFAARPEGEGRTRFFHCEVVPRRGAGFLRRLMTRNARVDVEGFRRLVEGPREA